MISVSEAQKIIENNLVVTSAEVRELSDCYGSVLAEDVFADRDYPPGDKALMDGIAVNCNAIQGGLKRLKVQGVLAAGKPSYNLESEENCIEIMTGAILPENCNCVIPVENINIENGYAIVNDGYNPQKGQFIQEKASQQKEGDCVIPKDTVVHSPQISIAATVGKSSLKVYKKLNVAVVSTGDELKDIDQEVEHHQIRKSNSYFIESALKNVCKVSVELFHFNDDKDLLLGEISKILKSFDMLVLTGGVSMGKFDFIPQVLDELKVDMLFHKVKQRPGKPFWVGKSKEKKMVFALPGNPISTQVCLYRYVLPSVCMIMGKQVQQQYAQLKENIDIKTDFAYFQTVKLCYGADGVVKAHPIIFKGSSDVASLGLSDGFIEIPENKKEAKKGDAFLLYRWDGVV